MKRKSKPTIGPVEFIDRVIKLDEKGAAIHIGALSAPRAGNGAQASSIRRAFDTILQSSYSEILPCNLHCRPIARYVDGRFLRNLFFDRRPVSSVIFRATRARSDNMKGRIPLLLIMAAC